MREKYPHSEFFWSKFPRIRTEYGEIRIIFPYSARMRENKYQKNSQYGHFSWSDTCNIAMTSATIYSKNRPPFQGLSYSFDLFLWEATL